MTGLDLAITLTLAVMGLVCLVQWARERRGVKR